MFPHRRALALARCSAAVLAAAALAGCCCDDDDDDPPPSPYFDLWEIEPNDEPCCPDVIGRVHIGDQFVIGGNIRDDSYDPFDGFELQSGEPLQIEFLLEPVCNCADLDLGVWDPVLGSWVLLWDSPSSVESGLFTIPTAFQDFQLVVMSYAGDAEYRLSVWVDPPSALAPDRPQPELWKLDRAVPLESYGGRPTVAPAEPAEGTLR